VHRQQLAARGSLLEVTRRLERQLFGFDQGEVTVVNSRAAHQATNDSRRIDREVAEQRLALQLR